MVSLNQRKMATVKNTPNGWTDTAQNKRQRNIFKITEQKGKVFSSKSLTNNSTNTSKKKSAITRSGLNYFHTWKPDKARTDVDSIKYMDVNEAVHGYHIGTSENKVLAPARPVPRYRTDMLTKAAKPQTLLPLFITESPCFPGW